jgi:hypothetical protein
MGTMVRWLRFSLSHVDPRFIEHTDTGTSFAGFQFPLLAATNLRTS